MTKKEKIERFLISLGKVKSKGFTLLCNACKSNNVIAYDDSGEGSEYTGAWFDSGIKCLDCGNSQQTED